MTYPTNVPAGQLYNVPATGVAGLSTRLDPLIQIAGMSAANTAAENTAAITSAFNSLPTTGGTLVLPSGTFNVNPWTLPDSRPLRIVGQGIGAYRKSPNQYDPAFVSATELVCNSADSPLFTIDKGWGQEFERFAIRLSDSLIASSVSGSTAILIGNGGLQTAARGGCNVHINRMAFVNFYDGLYFKDGVYYTVENSHLIGHKNYYLRVGNTLSEDESDALITGNRLYYFDTPSTRPTGIKVVSGGGLRICNNKFNVAGSASTSWWDKQIDIEFKNEANPAAAAYTGQIYIHDNSLDAIGNYGIFGESTFAAGGGLTSMQIRDNFFAAWDNASGKNTAIWLRAATGGAITLDGTSMPAVTTGYGGIIVNGNQFQACRGFVGVGISNVQIGVNQFVDGAVTKPVYELIGCSGVSIDPVITSVADTTDFWGGGNSPGLFHWWYTGTPRTLRNIPIKSVWASANNAITNSTTKTMFTLYFEKATSTRIRLDIEGYVWDDQSKGILNAQLERVVGGDQWVANNLAIKTIGTDTVHDLALTGGIPRTGTIAAGTGTLSSGTTKGLAHNPANAADTVNVIRLATAAGAGVEVRFESQIVTNPSIYQTYSAYAMALTISVKGLTADSLMVQANIEASGNCNGFAIGGN